MKEKLVYLDYLEKSYSKKIKYLTTDSLLDNIDLKKAKKYYEQLGCKCITFMCKEYPNSLKLIPRPPLVLYYIGNIKLINTRQIAIIGSRYNTEYGKYSTKHIVEQILGFTITSGYAYGIDQLAHIFAIKNNLRTIAVLGGGFDHIYPSNNLQLLKKIKEENLLISEYPPSVKPKPWHFLMRNRIIATLSEKIVVIEATKDSGSLKTVEIGIEQNKEIYALPGNIFSSKSIGTNLLIEEGANVITKDITFINSNKE